MFPTQICGRRISIAANRHPPSYEEVPGKFHEQMVTHANQIDLIKNVG